MSQKVLTIYGDRGWNPQDSAYCKTSMIRGYAGLNGAVNRLIQQNPDINVHSVSHSNILYPLSHGSGVMLIIFATVVYSGDITDLPSTFERRSGSEEKPLADTDTGYGTILKVDL